MNDDDESEFDDGEFVLVEGETLNLRMEYLKWCDLAHTRLMKSWSDLAFCLVCMAVLGVVVCIGIMQMTTYPPRTTLNTVGYICVVAGAISAGGPLGRSVRLLMDIQKDKRLFASYMHSARENVVMRRVVSPN